MGGLLLIMTLIAVYILCYWSIAIETLGDKTFGFLGFYDKMSQTLHHKKITKAFYQGEKKASLIVPPSANHLKKTYFKSDKKNFTAKKILSVYKKS